MICQLRFHCGCHSQTLVNPTEIEPRDEQRHRCIQILFVFAESEREPRKASTISPHAQIHALDMARANAILIDRAGDWFWHRSGIATYLTSNILSNNILVKGYF